MKSPKSVSYSLIIGDLFHYGHLKMLETAKQCADYHICGVISDNVVKKWITPLICNYEERKEVVDKIKYVDEAICQDSLDPTDNLKKIHERFPKAKILLVQNHILGGSSILGIDYIKEIGGEVIAHKFYSNLSRDYIRNAFVKDIAQKSNISKVFVNDIKIGDFDFFQKHFSTKANTIKSLKKILKNATIEKEFVFTVGQWMGGKRQILDEIPFFFKKQKIVIRSSSLNEDSIDFSNAGHYDSILDVNSGRKEEVEKAIEKVIESYRRADNHISDNQVLVQKQTEDVAMSGVVFTRNLWSNTPYYLINYDDDSTKTDTVTSGIESKKIEVLNDLSLDKVTPKWRNLIAAVREVESFFNGLTLDIEFAVKSNGEVVIFQVRPLAANSKFYSLDDDLIRQRVLKCIDEFNELKIVSEVPVLTKDVFLSDMSFWNPAELIGDRPNYLDYSLFNHLLMKSNWNDALLPLGYTKVAEHLMVAICNKPYINIHHAFLSLLPAELPVSLKKKLLSFYNSKIKLQPELHDKIEFEIVHNCFRFDLDDRLKDLENNSFSKNETKQIKKSLLVLTNKLLTSYKDHIKRDKRDIVLLEKGYNRIKTQCSDKLTWNDKLVLVYRLVEDCRALGTTQFSRLARMAFIGNSILKSLRDTGELSNEEMEDFMGSISTVATEMDDDFTKLRVGTISLKTFIDKYGHLRPGTYDITKLPYYKNSSAINSDPAHISGEGKKKNIFKNDSLLKISDRLTDVCKKHKLLATGSTLFDFIRKSIELREYYKFIYTKNISLAIELIAEVGENLGFSRSQVSNLDYYTIIGCKDHCSKVEAVNIWKNIINGRIAEKRIDAQVSLPPIIFSGEDFVLVPSYVSKPNFITNAIVEGSVVILDTANNDVDLNGKIVVIEKADPGYDWIFTKRIKALITKYGGAASHMAIRCAEFSIPAAIGCGDLLFSRIMGASKLSLDCKNKTIHTL